jgi:hypothetical protein
MAKSKGGGTRPPRQSSGIPSRDPDGTEHLLRVVNHPAGLVSISDDTMVRTLTPIAAVTLVMHLIHVMESYLPVRPGRRRAAVEGTSAIGALELPSDVTAELPGADAELLRLRGELAAARARSNEMHGVPHDATSEETRIAEAMIAHRATTIEGLRAKATAAAWQGMAESILRDLAA